MLTVNENNHHKTLTAFTSLAFEIFAMSRLWAITHVAQNTTFQGLKGPGSPIYCRLDGTTALCAHNSSGMGAFSISPNSL